MSIQKITCIQRPGQIMRVYNEMDRKFAQKKWTGGKRHNEQLRHDQGQTQKKSLMNSSSNGTSLKVGL